MEKFLEGIEGGSLVVYARAFELAGLTSDDVLSVLNDADLDTASRKGMVPILNEHRAKILAASAAHAAALVGEQAVYPLSVGAGAAARV